MLAMAPREMDIVSALQKKVCDIFGSEQRDDLTVKLVRTTVESDLSLEDGFLQSSNWKAKSKETIQTEVARLLDEESGPSPTKTGPVRIESQQATTSSPPTKKRARQAVTASQPPGKKRRKKEHALSDEDIHDSEVGETPKSKKAVGTVKSQRAALSQPKRKKEEDISSESELEGDSVDVPPSFDENADDVSKPKRRIVRKRKVLSDDEDDDESLESDNDHDGNVEKNTKKTGKSSSSTLANRKTKSRSMANLDDPDGDEEIKSCSPSIEAASKISPLSIVHRPSGPASPRHAQTSAEDKAHQSDSSEMSLVLDEAPTKPKKTKKSKQSKQSTNTASNPSKAATASNSALGVEIKTLQAQLLSCGIRKIWAFELKSYGDDEKAKIRHLQRMLADAGMKGRYSKARAREIKEERELMADLEAVREGEGRWGIDGEGNGGRPKRGAPKKVAGRRVSGSERRPEMGSGTDSDSGVAGADKEDPSQKRKRVLDELAFIGDQSSESDTN